MNYRHAFHAGNFADVFKHVLLTRLIAHLMRKPTAFRYLDTHAGRGWYDLASDEAQRGGEWPGGIGRLASAPAPAPVLALLEPYLAAVGPRDEAGRPALYPGSPAIAQAMLRPQDRLTLCELHPEEAVALRSALRRDLRAKVVAIDGYVALKAYLPPPERRGLVLIDPPFEGRDEFGAMLDGLRIAHRKWPTGVFALWYPIKDRAAVLGFAAALTASGIRRIAQAELIVDATALSRGALAGCGMIVVNPPFGLEEEAAVLLPFLRQALAREEPGSWRWRSLVQE